MSIFDSTALKIINSWNWGEFDYTTINIRFYSSPIMLDGAECIGLYTGERIKISSWLDENKTMATIIHEMRHMWQHLHGLLNDTVNPSSDLAAYENSPTELDARLWEFVYLARKTHKQDYMSKVKQMKHYELTLD